jgi:hypothetical protein
MQFLNANTGLLPKNTGNKKTEKPLFESGFSFRCGRLARIGGCWWTVVLRSNPDPAVLCTFSFAALARFWFCSSNTKARGRGHESL